MPAHAGADGLDLGKGSTRDRDVSHVVVLEMHQRAVDVIDLERAADAGLELPGRQHEMLDDQLAAAREEFRQRLSPFGPLERVVLVDLHPGEGAALGTQSSRRRVYSFSFARSALRAISHSAGETTSCDAMFSSSLRLPANGFVAITWDVICLYKDARRRGISTA